MKRKFVAFVLAMAVCANSATTAFAEQAQQPAGEWTEESATHVITGSTVTGTTTTESTNSNTEGTQTGIVEGSGETDSGIIGIIGGVDSTTEVTEEETPAESEEPAGETENTVEEQPKEETKKPIVTETIITSGEMTAEVEKEQPKTEEKSDTAVAEGSNTIQAGTIFASGEMTAKVKEDSDKKEGSDKKDENKKDDKDAAAEKAKQEAQKAISDYAKSIGYKDGRRYGDTPSWIPNHEYETEPVIGKDSCEPGKLADSTLKEGLDLINLIRKVAGLGEVTLDESYNEMAQLGALAMAASKDFSHYPTQGSNITDEQYKLGIKGTSNGNIGYGHTSLTDSILNGYMYDGDASNVGTMGHRRWILNPTMGKVGFGQVGDYNDMYAHDNSAENTLTDFVAWPAQNMPLELMPYYNSTGEVYNGTPWTCQLGSNYKITSSKNLAVTITRPDGSAYSVPQESIICNSQKYGYTNGCITIDDLNIYGMEEKIDDLDGAKYKVYGKPQAGDTYTVKIEGVLDKDGNKTTIEYDVNFFELGL